MYKNDDHVIKLEYFDKLAILVYKFDSPELAYIIYDYTSTASKTRLILAGYCDEKYQNETVVSLLKSVKIAYLHWRDCTLRNNTEAFDREMMLAKAQFNHHKLSNQKAFS